MTCERPKLTSADSDTPARMTGETAANLFARIRAMHGPLDIQAPPRGNAEPIEPWEL